MEKERNKRNKKLKTKFIKKKSVTGAKRIRASDKVWENGEKQLLSLLHHLETDVVVDAPDGRILFSNHSAFRILGLTEEQLQRKKAIDPAWHFVSENGTPMPLEEYPANRVISIKESIPDLVAGISRLVTKNRVWVIVNAFHEFDNSKQLNRIVVTFVDITSRKKAEERIQHIGILINLLLQRRIVVKKSMLKQIPD